MSAQGAWDAMSTTSTVHRPLLESDWDTQSIASTIRPSTNGDWDALSTVSTLVEPDQAPARRSSLSHPVREYTLALSGAKQECITISSSMGAALYTATRHKHTTGVDITLHPGGDSSSLPVAAGKTKRARSDIHICLIDTSSPSSSASSRSSAKKPSSAWNWQTVEGMSFYNSFRFSLPPPSSQHRTASYTSTNNDDTHDRHSDNDTTQARSLTWTRNTAALKLSPPRHYALSDTATGAVVALLDGAWEDRTRAGKLRFYDRAPRLLGPEQELVVLITMLTALEKAQIGRKMRITDTNGLGSKGAVDGRMVYGADAWGW